MKQISIDALRHALAIRPNTKVLDPEACPEVDDILIHCSSLVRLNAEGDAIELAHFTVEQFLRSIDINERSEWSRYAHVPSTVDNFKSESCLTYLLYDHFTVLKNMDPEEKAALLASWPFYEYACQLWLPVSTRSARSKASATLTKRLLALDKNDGRTEWMQQNIRQSSKGRSAEQG